MVHPVIEYGTEYSLHHNILINNNTTFDQYYKKIENIIVSRYDEGYDINVIPVFRIKVWNMDNMMNKHIRITKNARVILNPMDQQQKSSIPLL